MRSLGLYWYLNLKDKHMGSVFGGGDESQTTTSTTTVNLPGYIKRPLQNLIGRAESLSLEDYTPFTGDRIAQFTPQEQQAFDLASQLVGQTAPQIAQAGQVSQEVARRGLEGFSQAELQPYLNPYTENVLDVARRRVIETYDDQRQQLADRAAATGAFGGSRLGLQEAQLAEDFQRQLQEQETLGLASAYESALAGATRGTQLAGQAAVDQANLAQLGQQAGLTDIGALSAAGQAQRQLDQAQLDVNYQDFLTEQAFPYQQQEFLANILLPAAGLTAGQTATNTQTVSGGGSGLGNVLGLASVAAAPFTGGASLGFGGGFGGLSSSIGNLFSPQLSQGAIGLSQAGGLFNQGGQVKQYNRGGLASASDNYQGGGTVGQSVTNFLKLLRNVDRLNQEGVTGNDIIEGDYQILEDYPLYPGGPTASEYLDVQENIERGRTRAPMDRDMAPARGLQQVTATPTERNGGDYFDTLAFIESSNNPEAVNRHTGAAGLYQFIPSTAKAYGLEDPTDPVESRKAVEKLTEDNAKVLSRRLGRQPTDAELYLAHQQGATGASKLLENPDELAADVVGRGAVVRNGGTADMTAQEFANLWLNKFDQVQAQGYQEGGLVRLFPRLVEKGLERLRTGPEVVEPGPFASFGERLAIAGSNLPSLPERAVRGLASGVMEDVGGFTQGIEEFLTKPRISPEQSIQEGIEDEITSLERAKALYDAQNKLLQQRGLMATAENELEERGLPQPQQAPSEPILRVLDQVEDRTGVRPQSAPPRQAFFEEGEGARALQQPRKTEEQREERRLEDSINMPLLQFGAALLQSEGDFFQALGEGAQAYTATSMSLRDRQKQYAQQQLENRLRERAIAVQEGNLEARQRGNPFEQQLQMLKLERELGQADREQTKRIDNLAQSLIENYQAETPEEAYAVATQIILGNGGQQEAQEAQRADPLGLFQQ